MPQSRPFTAVPATRSSKKALQVKQAVIIGALVAGFLLGPLALVVASRSSSAVAEVSNSIPSQIPVSTVSFAEIVARDFVAARPTVMPTLKGVPRTLGFASDAEPVKGATVLFESVFPGRIGLVPVTITRFRVTTPASDDQLPRVYNLSVATYTDEKGRDYLASLPSLTPAVFGPADTLDSLAPTSEQEGLAPITDAVRADVAEWAKAYAANDSAQLERLVGGGGQYVGLGGFEVVSVDTPWAYTDTSGIYYVRARIGLRSTGANGFSPSIEFDLLVKDPNSSDPRIAAWGPPGWGPNLTEGMNRL